MVIDSVHALLDALRQCRLLNPEQEATACALQARCADAKALARELLRRDWLTPFQINTIFLGRQTELLLGSYVLLERVGEGGMGTVYKARNWKLGRIVALKLIRSERLTQGNNVRRFQREVQVAAQLSHPNIVMAYDADHVGDRHFLVMEYVEGIDLDRQVRQFGPLAADRARAYIRQAALALQHAHECGLVHRDIKPANLLLAKVGEVIKISDLGLARIITGDEEGASCLTQEGMVMGTIDYLAPEQARNSHAVDIRADLYSLGCTLYFLLTGRPPFAGTSPTEKLLHHQMDEPVAVEQLRPDVSPRLAAIVRKLMAKRPEARYQTPKEAAEALEGVAGEELSGGVATESEPVSGLPTLSFDDPAASTMEDPTSRQPRRRPVRWRWRFAIAAIVAVLVGMGASMTARLYRQAFSPEGSKPTEHRSSQPRRN